MSQRVIWLLLLLVLMAKSVHIGSVAPLLVKSPNFQTSPLNPSTCLLEERGGARRHRKKQSLLSRVIGFVKSIGKKAKTKAVGKKFKTTLAAESQSSTARIQKELKEFIANPPTNCKLASVSKSNIRKWIVTMTGIDGTVFAGEQYRLVLEFPKDYPAQPPSVYFMKPAPRHVHVYTNGDICLSILGKDWRPTMTAESIVVSILSMLSSAKAKSMPVDNAHHDGTPGQRQNYMYHDDRC